MLNKICVMGLGYIGLPTAITFANAGLDVYGFDINEAVVKSLRDGVVHIVEPGLQQAFDAAVSSGRLNFGSELVPADAFLIAVQTPYRVTKDGVKVAELKFVESAALMIAPHLKPGNLVVLESTVPPTTLRKVEEILERVSGLARDDFFCAHCPERVIPGQMLAELKNNDRVIGARLAKAAELAGELYSRVVTGGKLYLTDDITAEMCKLVENTYRDINIAYANELSVVADELGIDVYKLIEIANKHPRVNIHTPGVGVGGHCIAVDPWFITEMFPDKTPLIRNARLVNDGKPSWVAARVERELLPGESVCVLGMTYKADIDDMRESPSIELCKLLAERGVKVSACEPNISAETIDGFDNRTLDEVLRGNDFLVITLKHKRFAEAAAKLSGRRIYDCVGLL